MVVGELASDASARQDGGVSVAIILLVLFVVIPVGVLVSCGALAAVLGWLLDDDADQRYEGTEYVELGG